MNVHWATASAPPIRGVCQRIAGKQNQRLSSRDRESLLFCGLTTSSLRAYAGESVFRDLPAGILNHVRLVRSPHGSLCFFRILIILSGL